MDETDTQRPCMDCGIVIVPDEYYPYRRRCYSCIMIAMDVLMAHVAHAPTGEE